MAEPDFDTLFTRFRETPWSADPNAGPQERRAGNGNIESQGWLEDGSVTADVIQANAVIAGKIDANAVTAGTIAADAVTAREIAADSVTASEIAANTITANEIAANTITANEIAANTITANEIAANAVTASEIAANAVTADEIAANTITSNEIAANTITAAEIAADAITTTELAANAVIAENILAGEVTSAKIVSTITGKSFGANAGTAGAPGYYFDADSSTGLHFVASIPFIGDIIGISIDGTQVARFSGFGIGVGGNVDPLTDSTYDLGSTSNRWDVVYRISESAVSDANRKTDIEDAPLGLEFVQSLKPRVFRWKDAVDTQARQSAAVDGEAMARECEPYLHRIVQIRKLQITGQMSDEDGDEMVDDARAALSEIRDRYQRPALEAAHKRRPGRRLHYGLIAQEVKAALDKAGVDSMDAAFWQESPDGEQALSYSELLIPLLRAVQELAQRVESLESA